MTSEGYSPLNLHEEAWVQERLYAGQSFVALFSPADGDQPASLEALERAYDGWLAGEPQDEREINDVILTVGVCFGEFLVNRAGFMWVIAEQDGSSNLAVRALPGHSDVIVYPADFIAKRWERREHAFLALAFEQIHEQVRKLGG